jgi:hypothetical protein
MGGMGVHGLVPFLGAASCVSWADFSGRERNQDWCGTAGPQRRYNNLDGAA